MRELPAGARKFAVYFYGGGEQIHIYAKKRRIYFRDEKGEYPLSLHTGTRAAHPDEGDECGDTSFDTLGLYYAYAMPDTGWDGDC